MGFHKLDFLSSAPRGFIFQRNSNKTNLGGVLSLIYLIIILIIAAYYLVFYFLEDNYRIEYLYYEEILSQEQNLEKKRNPKYNPTFTFNISLYEGSLRNNKPVEDRFIIKDWSKNNHPTVDKFGSYKKNITEVDWIIFYDCLDEDNCQIDTNKTKEEFITLRLDFAGYKFDHQNKDSPFHILDKGGYTYIPQYSLYNPTSLGDIWSVVKYKEEKGFFSIFDVFRNKDEDDDKYIGAIIKSFETNEFSDDFNSKNIFYYEPVDNNTIHCYKLVGEFYFLIDFNHYEEYKRTPKSFWDAIANICSLCITVLNGISFVFMNYYSNNFDNYKIMENILFNAKTQNEKKEKDKKEIELSDDFNKTDNLIDNNNEEKDIIITNEEKEKPDNDNNIELIKDNKDIDEKDNSDNLPKFRFIDFLLNNFYCDKTCKQNRQKIIAKCNEIISKYYSIEKILYNQIKIENLLKDYKWNDSRLSKLGNNELIIQLKNLIAFNYGS